MPKTAFVSLSFAGLIILNPGALSDATRGIPMVDPDIMLHQIVKPKNSSHGRINVSPDHESLQVAHIRLKFNQTFKAHKHVLHNRNMPMAQESWVVIKGSVKCTFYDLDDTIISNDTILKAGDASFTLYGGHTYEILEENTIVYEYKTGPYEGQKLDKVMINTTPRGVE